jgi:hypothetical protein
MLVRCRRSTLPKEHAAEGARCRRSTLPKEHAAEGATKNIYIFFEPCPQGVGQVAKRLACVFVTQFFLSPPTASYPGVATFH